MTLAGMSSTPGAGRARLRLPQWLRPRCALLHQWSHRPYGLAPASIVLNSTNWNTGITLTLVPVNDQKNS